MNSKDSRVIDTNATVSQALTRLNELSGRVMTLFVENSDGKIVGTLTDGDVRRGLIAGIAVGDTVDKVMHRNFRFIHKGEDNFNSFCEARDLGIALIPELDDEGRLCKIIDVTMCRSMLPIDAVLMAGGRGERLRPLTISTPKPLLHIGGKPIIDYNIEALEHFGVNSIFVSVNYLREQIINHFAAVRPSGITVKCVPEDAPLGTFGAVSLIDDFSHDDVLVMNSDLLTDLDFEAMYRQHRRSEAALTMAVTQYTVSVPFAILHTEGDSVVGMEEKPTYNYLANAGVYIVRREYLALLNKGERIDAPDFIDLLISKGEKVGYFLIDGTWIDIGSPDDFRYASDLMERKS